MNTLEKVNIIPAPDLPLRGPADQIVPATPTMEIIRAALATGDVEMYREAVALAKELDAIAARKAFDNAMADAKAEIPTIKRNRRVDAGARNGKEGPKYRFEDLAEIANTVDPILSKHGLSYRYKVSSDINQPVRVTCIVSHRAGHFEETTLTAGRDDGPGRNAIQQVGSTITYLQRYTLKAALGLAVSHDDDGVGSESSSEALTQEQLTNLIELADEVGADKRKFCAVMKVESLAAIPQDQYQRAIDLLNTKRKRQ